MISVGLIFNTKHCNTFHKIQQWISIQNVEHSTIFFFETLSMAHVIPLKSETLYCTEMQISVQHGNKLCMSASQNNY